MAARGGALVKRHSHEDWLEACRQGSILEAMQSNLYAAMAYAVSSGQTERGLRICADMHWAVVTGGRYDDFLRLLDRLLDNAAKVPPGVVGEALGLRAALVYFSGEPGEVRETVVRALTLSRLGGNLRGETFALIVQA